jgi:AAA-like domain
MNVDEALLVLDIFLQKRLNNLQEFVFRKSWEGQTYQEMAESASYDANYVKDVGSKLWKLLSQTLEEEVTKSNFRSVLRRRAEGYSFQRNSQDVQAPAKLYQQLAGKYEVALSDRTTIESTPENKGESLVASLDSLEVPGGPVPLNSLFYIERPPIEERAYAESNKPGSLIRIKAPRQMGKTSLMHRILSYAKQTGGVHTILISLQLADNHVFTSLDKFLRWFCANVSRQLNIEPKLDDYWDEDIGSKVSCTLYFQEYLLQAIDSPVILALDEVNRIFEYPDISSDFLPLLRSWYEDASELEIWRKLRLIVVHATEAYIPLDINQSPFNVGLAIKLSEFNLEQVQDLAVRHGLDWAKGALGAEKLSPLMDMIGGHPYLVRLALYNLACQNISLEQLLQEAPTIGGIYSNYLRHHLANLQEHPELGRAFQQVVKNPESMHLEAIAAYKLESMGLVKLEGNQAIPSCELYRLYFCDQLG